MAHWRSLLPNPRYLAAFQLNGKDVTVEISRVVSEEVIGQDGKRDQCMVVYFKGAKLPWICNKTNGSTIAKLYGNDTDNWIGKMITVYPTTIIDKKTKEVVECTRCKSPPKPEPTQSITPDTK